MRGITRTEYYVVLSPGTGAESGLKMEQIRHTYLHYLLDPMALKYPGAMDRLKPLLASVKGSPMDESFRTDVSLLTTECMIRAIEARTTWTSKTPEVQKQQLVQQSVEQGYILTPYFYEALAQFEKSPIGLRTAYPGLINDINVGKEQRNAAQVKFASTADEELLHLSRHTQGKLLLTAQQRLASGDVEGAKKLAQQALDEKNEDPGRALFILAQAAGCESRYAGGAQLFRTGAGGGQGAVGGSVVACLSGKNLRSAGRSGGGPRPVPCGIERRRIVTRGEGCR